MKFGIGKNVAFFVDVGRSIRLITAALNMLLLLSCMPRLALAEDNLEYKIKAAYLYNFTKFITWPEKHSATFNICIVGNNAFGDLLAPLEQKTAFDKPIRLFHFDNFKQIQDCHIVYFEKFAARGEQSLAGVLVVSTLKESLTVSSQAFFAEQGGMIGFVMEDEKIKLHINLKALQQNGLSVSAKLIEVSTLVGGGE